MNNPAALCLATLYKSVVWTPEDSSNEPGSFDRYLADCMWDVLVHYGLDQDVSLEHVSGRNVDVDSLKHGTGITHRAMYSMPCPPTENVPKTPVAGVVYIGWRGANPSGETECVVALSGIVLSATRMIEVIKEACSRCEIPIPKNYETPNTHYVNLQAENGIVLLSRRETDLLYPQEYRPSMPDVFSFPQVVGIFRSGWYPAEELLLTETGPLSYMAHSSVLMTALGCVTEHPPCKWSTRQRSEFAMRQLGIVSKMPITDPER